MFETRLASPSDADGIAAAHQDSIRAIGPRFYPLAIVDEWGAHVTPSLYVRAMERGVVFFIAVADATVLGFASHYIEGTQHGTGVYVRGDASRHGIGSALFKLAEAHAVAAGATSLEIDASLAAVEFYRANGFEEIGRGHHQLSRGGLMACVFMRKILG